MLAPPPQRHKRPRSPTPPPSTSSPDIHHSQHQYTHPSPLDILIKRRRRSSPELADPYSSSASGQSDGVRQGINGRRSRQWAHLNAPPSASAPYSSSSTSSNAHSNPFISSFSQPNPHPPPLSPPSGPSTRAYHSQPDPDPFSQSTRQHDMSSSPIRHHPPSSSPFRGASSGGDTRIGDEAEVSGWTEDEMRREWGDEYGRQNSLLHTLHLARQAYQPFTPDTTLLQTPASSSHLPLHHPPSSRGHYPARPSSSSGPTPYRTSYFPSSSPYPSRTLYNGQSEAGSPYVFDGQGPGDESMEFEHEAMLSGGSDEGKEDEVKRRYEEANRLLAELDVVRRQRWGQHQGG